MVQGLVSVGDSPLSESYVSCNAMDSWHRCIDLDVYVCVLQ